MDVKLNSNEIFAGLENMIISQQVFTGNIKGTYSDLMESARVDGSLYGDQKLYYASDVLVSQKWGNDAEAKNLLELHRPKTPDKQSIVLDQFRQISLTVDNYLTKRAWMKEGAFSDFNGVMLAWIRDTKRIYESKYYNTYIGITKTNVGKQSKVVTVATADKDKQAQLIAKAIADLFVELKDASRNYNDFENERSYSTDELVIVSNADIVNNLKYLELPTIFHKDGLIDKLTAHMLPSYYFGTIISSGGTGDGVKRSLVEKDYNTVKQNSPSYDKKKHIFPGDIIPSGSAYGANEAYTPDPKIVCKIMSKKSVPLMSAFEVGTSFFNPKSLTENHYLTWGFNTLQYLKNYPFITISIADGK